MTSRTTFRWSVALGLAASAFVLGACFHVGDQTGTCAPGNVCTCDGIGNCTESCPSGGCNFSCTGVGNCNVTCEGGDCSLSCSGTGNCNLNCTGGNCTSNCIGRTNCVCENCSDIPDANIDSDAGTTVDANATADAFVEDDDANTVDANAP